MANLAGRSCLSDRLLAAGTNPAVEEWQARTAATLPGDAAPPRNTLRGHPQPWKTRAAHAVEDEGPLHYSAKFVPGADYGYKVPIYRDPGPGVIPSSTAAVDLPDWEQRLTKMQVNCGLRGSTAPNWKPRVQEDLTATGSVNPGNWQAGTTAFKMPGTITRAELQAAADAVVPGPTWSTATTQREEWEQRLDKEGVAM